MKAFDEINSQLIENQTFSPLLLEMQDGNSVAWHRFARQYEQMIQRWLLSFGASPNDVDDIKQEVNAFVFHRLPKFEHNGRRGAFRNWLKKITLNRLREHRRKRTGKQHVSLPENVELADSLAELSLLHLRQHFSAVADKCLQRLSRHFQPNSVKIFRETVLKGRPIHQVATELGMSQVAVRVAKSRVQRAYLKMFQELVEGSDQNNISLN